MWRATCPDIRELTMSRSPVLNKHHKKIAISGLSHSLSTSTNTWHTRRSQSRDFHILSAHQPTPDTHEDHNLRTFTFSKYINQHLTHKKSQSRDFHILSAHQPTPDTQDHSQDFHILSVHQPTPDTQDHNLRIFTFSWYINQHLTQSPNSPHDNTSPFFFSFFF